ncbi:ankyrin repeat domain-containing protein [Microbacterium sp. SD291]|uniref:ankyrin repeat domain-containing protein n=1 Tax=Microbacterium sp. SD291 TaxID=2782007 RepID=UPI001A9577BE|nr:ankyrin repeat domain-containing protein [Microbacterium sp. SD291]MBO0980525.1 ankyrin repeat domain-containing protein [Microbacterium sp. SD291]
MSTTTDQRHLELTATDQRYLERAAAGDLDGVRSALAEGADKNAVDREEATAILRAARGGHLDVVRALIAEGVDIDAQDQTCFNPFIHGCIFDELELVMTMVEAGTDLKRLTRMGGNGLTPSAEKGHLEVVRYLLENTRINVNLTNNLGWTALIETIILGDGGPVRQEIVELLLAHGAKPGMPDPMGVPPVELARQRGFDEIVRILESHQA